jgi:Family of unknown function (DUF6178)
MSEITRAARRSDNLLSRILDTPHLERVVPHLPPAILHRVVETCGLEDCGELVSLATPEQLSAIFDLDLWRSRQPGHEEDFDAARFAVWLEVLAESGAAFAAQRLAEIDTALVIAALAHHIAVFDPAAFLVSDTDGAVVGSDPREGLHCEVGGYIVAARNDECWDTIVAVLVALEEQHRDRFHHVMQACRRLSNSTPEADGFHDLLSDPAQDRFDLAFGRERRRDQQGYVTPAQSRAFLQSSRELRLDQSSLPPASPVVAAFFRAVRSAGDAVDAAPAVESGDPTAADDASATAAVFELLVDAGVVPDTPRALLTESQNDNRGLGCFARYMQSARDFDPAAYGQRTEELAFLANVLVSGCALLDRHFSTREAFDGATAVCNLGLENWPRQWLPHHFGPATETPLPLRFLVEHDLTAVFRVGWAILHQEVCLFVTRHLIELLDRVRVHDRDVQIGLLRLRTALRRSLDAGTPWHARDAFDVIALIDMPAWAALLGLVAECPVMLANVSASTASKPLTVDPTSFQFISESAHIASVHAFMRSLPDMFSG